MKKILVVGHSHVNALKDSNPEEGFEFCSLVGANGLANFVKKNIPPSEYDALVCSIQGSQYNIFGLVKHQQPFDFYLSDEPGLPIDEDAELLPLSLVTAVFKRDLRATFNILNTIKKYPGLKLIFWNRRRLCRVRTISGNILVLSGKKLIITVFLRQCSGINFGVCRQNLCGSIA